MHETALEMLDSTLVERGHELALIFHDREITYRELCFEVSRLVCGLCKNFRSGELLVVWLPNCPELLCIYLACLKTGVVPVPLHRGMKWPEVLEVLKHAQATALVTSKDILDTYAAELCNIGQYRIYVVGQLTQEGGKFSRARMRPDDLAVVLHTSGSHGRPKGVMLSHGNIDHILRYRLAHTKLTSDSISVVASCLTQSVGLHQSLALLAVGGTMVLLESYDVDQMAECIHRYQPTHLIMVVEAFDRLLHQPTITEASFTRLSFACVGADRVTARVQARFMALTGRPLRVSYGLTESSWALINPGDNRDKCLALGKPCSGIEIKLVGLDGREKAIDEVGEIYIKSPRTMLGYLNDEHLTRDVFTNGWLATGDLAYRDVEGYFWFAGRKKNIIVLSTGDNVSPIELEDVILRHPKVSHCAVVAIATPHDSDAPCAFIVRRDRTLSEATMKQFLRERISDYKIPHKIVFVQKLPVGLTGKIQHEDNGISGDDAASLARAPSRYRLLQPERDRAPARASQPDLPFRSFQNIRTRRRRHA